MADNSACALLALALVLLCGAHGNLALAPGEWHPSGSTEAEVSGTATDYVDVGSQQYNLLIDFNDYYLNVSSSPIPVTFSDPNHRLMTEYMAEQLTALAMNVSEQLLVVRGFEPRPTTPVRPPGLIDIGRGLRLRYLNSGGTPDRLADLANKSIEVGFDFVAHPGGANYINVSTPVVDCGQNAVDLLFILDGSGSIRSSNFQTMLAFTETVVAFFDVSPDTTRIGVMVYSSDIHEQFDFTYILSNNTRDDLLAAIRGISYPGGSTQTGAALDYARTTLFTDARGVRPASAGVPRVAIVITDGQSGDSVTQPAEDLRNENVNIFAIGISGADVDELNEIASEPISTNVKFIDTFTEFSQLPAEISRANCEQPALVSSTDEVQINDTQPGEIRLFRPNPTNLDESVNLQMEIISGQTDVFVSVTSPNPGPFNFDYAIMNDEPLKSLMVRKETDQLISIAVRSRLASLGRRRTDHTISYRLRVFNDLFNGPASHSISVTPTRNQAGAPIFQAPEAVNFPGLTFTYSLSGPDQAMFDIDAATGRITLASPLPDSSQHYLTLIGQSGNTAGGLSIAVAASTSTTTLPPARPASSSDTDPGVLAGAIVGGILGLLLIVGVAVVITRNASGSRSPSKHTQSSGPSESPSAQGPGANEWKESDYDVGTPTTKDQVDTRHNPTFGQDV